MFGRVPYLPLRIFFWVNISEFPYSSSAAKIRILDLDELFHNVMLKKFALLVVFLNSELYCNFFCSSYSFCCYCKAVSLQDKITSKLILLIFFIWFAWLSVKFLHSVWYIQTAHELHTQIFFINVFYCIFYNCLGV